MRDLRTALLLVACLSLLSSSPLRLPNARGLRQRVMLSGFLLAKAGPSPFRRLIRTRGISTRSAGTVSSANGMSQTIRPARRTLYPWSWTYPKSKGVMPSSYWSPQSMSRICRPQGHAELLAATVDSLLLSTFSPGAAQAAIRTSGGSLETHRNSATAPRRLLRSERRRFRTGGSLNERRA